MTNPHSSFRLKGFLEAEDGGRVLELLPGSAHGIDNVSIAWVDVDAGVKAQPHWHKRSEEVYLIVQGCPTAVLDGRRYELEPGDAFCIPVGKVHWLENPGEEPVRYAAISSPPYAADDMFLVP